LWQGGLLCQTIVSCLDHYTVADSFSTSCELQPSGLGLWNRIDLTIFLSLVKTHGLVPCRNLEYKLRCEASLCQSVHHRTWRFGENIASLSSAAALLRSAWRISPPLRFCIWSMKCLLCFRYRTVSHAHPRYLWATDTHSISHSSHGLSTFPKVWRLLWWR
jgi:hypothetical protein